MVFYIMRAPLKGYLFGELLKRFRQLPQDEGFVDHHTIEAKIVNFKKLLPVFKSEAFNPV